MTPTETLPSDNCLPTRGLSDVIGIMADTVFRNIVNDSRMVTPSKHKKDIENITRELS